MQVTKPLLRIQTDISRTNQRAQVRTRTQIFKGVPTQYIINVTARGTFCLIDST